MNGIYFTLLVIMTHVFALTAYALETDFYVGVGGGEATYKNNAFTSGESFNSAQDDPAYNLTAGFVFNKSLITEFVYSNFNTTSNDSISCSFYSSCRTVNYNIDIETYAVYTGLRTSKPVYFLIKLGYVYGESKFSDPFVHSSRETLSGISFSAGSGVEMGPFHLLLEETTIKSSIHYISLTLNYYF